MPFKFLEDEATADIAFTAENSSINGLFEDCAKALFETMVDTSLVKQKREKKLSLKEESVEKLLYKFLQELVYLKDVEYTVYSSFSVKVDETKNSLEATLKGEPIDQTKHGFREDVKAVTLHLFELKKQGNNWTAKVLLDV
ncbi:MAG: archease [archaeon]|nr:archease [archaeon]